MAARYADLLRERLMSAVAACPEDAVIWLSGGIDSASLLAAALALGREPPLMTFKLEGAHEHPDLRIARSMAETVSLHLDVVEIPRARLAEDARALCRLNARYSAEVGELAPVYKVFVQVAHGCSYMLDGMRERGLAVALAGFCADSYWGSGRKMEVMLRKEGRAGWQAYRERYLVSKWNSESFVYWLAKRRGLAVIDPWADQPVRELMLGLGPAQMHVGRKKGLALHAFPELWRRGAWARDNSSLQVNSGLRGLHDSLLHTHNPRGRKAIIGLYNDWAKA